MCISWTIKCLISLMHGAKMKFKDLSCLFFRVVGMCWKVCCVFNYVLENKIIRLKKAKGLVSLLVCTAPHFILQVRSPLAAIPISKKLRKPKVLKAQWLRCCATNRKVAGSIPDGVIGIFHWHNPSDRTEALGSTQPLTEMSTRRISWGENAAGA